jgi:hypothetical protein
LLTVSGENSKGNEELVTRYERTSHVAWRGLGLVHGRKDRKSSYTQTGDPTTKRYLVPCVCCGNLNDDPDAEDDVPEDNGVFATEFVGDRGGDYSTHEGTDRKQRDN